MVWTSRILYAARPPAARRPAASPAPAPGASADKPVSRAKRMQRLEDAPPTTFARLSRTVDQWSDQQTKRTLWGSWMGFSLAGLYVADWLEDRYPAYPPGVPATPELAPGVEGDRKPRLFSISVVDRP